MQLSCVGNALYDVISFVEPKQIQAYGFTLGVTAHVDISTVNELISKLPKTFCNAGGGAANVARVFAALGNDALFAGKIGNDQVGRNFSDNMDKDGVKSFLQIADAPTGLFCVLLSPPSLRTTIVAPSIAPDIDVDSIPSAFFSNKSVLYIDGFLASKPESITKLIHRANNANMDIALDVGGCHIAKENRMFFLDIIKKSALWTFMNEDEFNVLSESTIDKSLVSFSAEMPGTIVVKRGESGAVVVSVGSIIESAVRPLHPTDTTGAGDAFAAGFLSAAFLGEPLQKCLRAGNRVAEHAIQSLGLDTSMLQNAINSVLA